MVKSRILFAALSILFGYIVVSAIPWQASFDVTINTFPLFVLFFALLPLGIAAAFFLLLLRMRRRYVILQKLHDVQWQNIVNHYEPITYNDKRVSSEVYPASTSFYWYMLIRAIAFSIIFTGCLILGEMLLRNTFHREVLFNVNAVTFSRLAITAIVVAMIVWWMEVKAYRFVFTHAGILFDQPEHNPMLIPYADISDPIIHQSWILSLFKLGILTIAVGEHNTSYTIIGRGQATLLLFQSICREQGSKTRK